MRYETINPATGERIEELQTMPPDVIREIAASSRRDQAEWRERPIADRAKLFHSFAAVLRRERDRYARLMTMEMGKPLREAQAEVEKCAWLSEMYAEKAEGWLVEETVEADGELHLVVFEPLGTVLSVMPWNYPFWQAIRFAVPAIVAGNSSLLKHARNVPQCAFAIEEAFRDAGFPENVFRNLLADHDSVAELIAGDQVQGVSLTGSTTAGERIAETAGRSLKKVVLELGGSDPFVVLEDADVEFAARGAVAGRFLNTGQSCIAAKRFIVVESLAEEFAARFAALASELVVGDPMDEATQIGPVVDEKALEELLAQLEQSVAIGGQVLAGGSRLDRPGFYLAPTVVSGCNKEMRIVAEEVFGPIAPVISVKDEEEAIRVANDSEFGLGGSVWTRDLDRGQRLARRLECGLSFVNSSVKSDPRMPFGGIKRSGIGRELSKYGLREFLNIKGINVYRHGDGP